MHVNIRTSSFQEKFGSKYLGIQVTTTTTPKSQGRRRLAVTRFTHHKLDQHRTIAATNSTTVSNTITTTVATTIAINATQRNPRVLVT